MAYDWFTIAKEQGFDTPKDLLTKLYITDDYTLQDIADLVGCSTWAVSSAIGRFEIARRAHGGTRRREMSAAKISSVIDKLKEQK